jgi:ATP-dependent DNA helicase RecG
VGLLHGRLSGEEKDEALAAFAEGRTQVLITTTVVEVGVDVAEASVMVVEHAERFGLAQLHQLRHLSPLRLSPDFHNSDQNGKAI